MARNDVEIKITAKDAASPAFAQLVKSAERAQHSIGGLGESASRMNGLFMNLTGFAAAATGIYGFTETVGKATEEILDYYKIMQQGAIATAGTLMSVGQIDGKDLEWNDALIMSTGLMKKLADQAIATGVSTKELAYVFRVGLAPALRGGMNIEQYTKLLAPLTAVGKMLGLNDTNLMRDISDIMSGLNVSRTKMGQVLGITGAEVKKASAEGKLFEYLNMRLQGEVMATTKYLETWEGRVNHLKEAVARVGGESMKGAFDTIKEDIQAVAERLVIVDTKTQEIYIRNDAMETFKKMNDLIVSAEQQIGGLISDIGSVGSALNVGGASLETIKFAVDHLREGIELYALLTATSKTREFVNGVTLAFNQQAAAQGVVQRIAASAGREIMVQQKAITDAVNEETTAMVKGNKELAKKVKLANDLVIAESKRAQNRAVRIGAGVTSNYSNIANEAGVYTAAAAEKVAAENAVASAAYRTTAAYGVQQAAVRNNMVASAEAGYVIQRAENNKSTAAAKTTAALKVQQAQYAIVGAAATSTGVVANRAMTSQLGMMAKVTRGIKGMTAAVYALSGGWLGLAVVAGYAGYEMYRAKMDNNAAMKENDITLDNGTRVTKNKDGKYYVWGSKTYTDEFGEEVTSSPGWMAMGDSIKDRFDRYAYDSELEKREITREAQAQAEALKRSERVTSQMNGILGRANDISYRNMDGAEDQETVKKAADAHEKYNSVLQQNGDLINKANAKMRDIISSLQEQLMKINGSKYDEDIASARKSFMSTQKNIAESKTTLKSIKPSVLALASGGGNASMVEEAANHLGEQWGVNTCAEFVSGIAKAVGIDSVNSSWVPDIINSAQNKDAYYGRDSGYVPQNGDLVIWGGDEHIGISDGTGGHISSDTHGVVHVDASQEDTYYGKPVSGYISMAQMQGNVNLAPTSRETYTPYGVDLANSMNEKLFDERVAEAKKNLATRQRKQDSETLINMLSTAVSDERDAVLAQQLEEKIAELKERREEIYKAIAGDTSDKEEVARANLATDKAIAAEEAKIRMESFNQQQELDEKRLEERLKHNQNLFYTEQATQNEILGMNRAALEEYIGLLREKLKNDKLTAIQRLEVESQLSDSIKKLNENRHRDFSQMSEKIKDLMRNDVLDYGSIVEDGYNSIKSTFTSFGQNMLTESKSVKERLENLFRDLANNILNMGMKMAMNGIWSNLIGGLTRGFGASPMGHATGGYITGPGTSTSDSIPAYLSNGEYVVNASAVNRVGVSFLDSINSGYIKRFATGGMVGNAPSGSAGKPNFKVNITNNTGNEISAENSDINFDGESYVLSIVVNGIATNKMGMRTLLKGI